MPLNWLYPVAIVLSLLPGCMSTPASLPTGVICGQAEAAGAAALPSPAGQLLRGYGNADYKIRTSNAAAQQYFDNGVQLALAFEHRAAIAAFRRAERLDPNCAMCVWGEAWARGPTINYGISQETTAALAVLSGPATELAKNGAPRERLLTLALAARYQDGGGSGRGDVRYAQAMRELARSAPDDAFVQVLTAEAWLVPDFLAGEYGRTSDALALLRRVLARDPRNVGAMHYFIHAAEALRRSSEARTYAMRLPAMTPASSHLVHMPSHTFYQLGEYQAAVSANLAALSVDAGQAVTLGQPRTLIGPDYHAHNVHYGMAAALMSGDAASGLRLARGVLAATEKTSGDRYLIATAYAAMGRFGDLREVLALEAPPSSDTLTRALWRYARGEAFARSHDVTHLRHELSELTAEQTASIGAVASDPLGSTITEIAKDILGGRLAMALDDPARAQEYFTAAARLQETVLVDIRDPPLWWYPVRRSVAAAALRAGKPNEALPAAGESLKFFPNDPLALWVQARAKEALSRADRSSAPSIGVEGSPSRRYIVPVELI